MEAAKERYHDVAEAKTDEADAAEARVAQAILLSHSPSGMTPR